jgi:hypothetical protein
MNEPDVRFGQEGVPIDAAALTQWNAQQGARSLRCPVHRSGIALVATEGDDTLQWICPVCGQRQPVLRDQALTALGAADAPSPVARQLSTSLDYLPPTPGLSSDGTILLGSYHASPQVFDGKDDRAISAGGVAGVAAAGILDHWVTLAPLLWVLMVATPMIAYFVRRRPTAPIARSRRLPLSSVRPGDWLAIAEPRPNRPVRLHPAAGNAHAARVLQVTRIGATGELLCNLMGEHHLEARDNQLVTVFELADPRANDYSFHTLGPIAAPTDDDEHRLVAVENNEQSTANQIAADGTIIVKRTVQGDRRDGAAPRDGRDLQRPVISEASRTNSIQKQENAQPAPRAMEPVEEMRRHALAEMRDYAISVIGSNNPGGITRSGLLQSVGARYPLAFTMGQSLERALAREARWSGNNYGLLGDTWVTQNRQVQRLRDTDRMESGTNWGRQGRQSVDSAAGG